MGSGQGDGEERRGCTSGSSSVQNLNLLWIFPWPHAGWITWICSVVVSARSHSATLDVGCCSVAAFGAASTGRFLTPLMSFLEALLRFTLTGSLHFQFTSACPSSVALPVPLHIIPAHPIGIYLLGSAKTSTRHGSMFSSSNSNARFEAAACRSFTSMHLLSPPPLLGAPLQDQDRGRGRVIPGTSRGVRRLL